jgi:predicted ferric reductase
MLFCNLNALIGNNFLSGTSSKVTYDEVSDLIRIEMLPGASTSPKPGQHYFVYQGGILKFWENHPFSLGAWAPASGSKGEGDSSAKDQNKLIFYVRPYDGWTRRLRDQCRKANGFFEPKLLLEGPYGHSEPLHHFDTNLIVVGGTGIAAAVPYLLSHLERVKTSQTKTLKIHLVWVVRQREMWDQVFTADLEQVLQRSDISITVYCTKLSSSIEISSSNDSRSSVIETPKEKLSTITAATVSSPTQTGPHIMPGRPNVRELVLTEVEESKASSSSIGIFTCGPAQMADECRSSVYEAMKHGFHQIDYFEEAFGW